MKIPAINLNVVNFRANAQSTAPQYAATHGNLAPLAQDTVNFTGGKAPNVSKAAKKAAKEVAETAEKTVNGLRADKVLDDNAHPEFNYKIAKQLEKRAAVPMAYRRSIKEMYFRKFVIDKGRPENPKRFITLSGRIKKAPQIADKLMSVSDNIKKKANEVGDDFVISSLRDAESLLDDILGDRTVLHVLSKKAGATALATSEQIVKDGKQIITKIEVYAPVIRNIPEHILRKYEKELGVKLTPKDIKMITTQPDFFILAPRDSIDSLADTCRKKYSNLDVNGGRDRPNGYIAIHQNYRLPDGSTGEEQVMLKSVELLKDIEDVIYKAKGNKPVISKQVKEFLENSDTPKAKMLLSKITELERRLAPLSDGNETELVAMVDDYTRWAYVGQALKDLPKFKKTATDKFLVAPKELLARGLGFNQLKPYAKAVAEANQIFDAAQKAKSQG